MRRYTLLIDADDTLWENNVFYEKLIEDFVTVVEPYGYTRAYIRHILNETERKNIRQYGYGVRSFGRSLEETYLKLADQMARREMLAQIHSRVMELERTRVLGHEPVVAGSGKLLILPSCRELRAHF